MTRTTLMMSCAALLAAAPLASASCHWCVGDAVDDCAALEAGDCAGSAVHLGTHAPALALEAAREAAEGGCEGAESLSLASVAVRPMVHLDPFVPAPGC